MSDQTNHSAGLAPGVRRIVTAGTLIFAAAFVAAVLAAALYVAIRDDVFSLIVKEHFIGVFGPPVATVASMALVLVFRVAGGPMEFKALGVEFKGASGPAILWCFSFLLQILALGVLWKLD